MAYVLTERTQKTIARLIKTGRYNNQSEVIRAGLGLLEQKELGYLNPPPIPEEELAKIYREQSKEEEAEEIAAAKASSRL
jgi:putative addiction module CopG family antidote